MTPAQFVDDLRSISFENAFNPYADRCGLHDSANAPSIRSATISAMVHAATECDVESIWIGRDLGYRGGRRTGLALTDDRHLSAHAQRWCVQAARPTRGDVVAERTAAVIWGVLSCINAPVFLWNVFPFHPHEPGTPLTNRPHNASERQVGEALLDQLMTLLKPQRLICIGNDAAAMGRRLQSASRVLGVRHPSYGGQRDFVNQLRELYALPRSS